MNPLHDLLNTLQAYAEERKKAVAVGLETAATAALLIEQFSGGLISAIKSLGETRINCNQIKQEAKLLARSICPDYHFLSDLRKSYLSQQAAQGS